MDKLTPKIIYKDKDVLVIEKPAGLIVHEDQNRGEPTVVAWLLENFPEVAKVGDDSDFRPGIVHRLDKGTSGLMIIARTQKAFEYLKELFQTKKIKKTYLALVWGKVSPRSGIIDKPMGIKPDSVKRTVNIKDARMVKDAKTIYRVKEEFGEYTLLEVEPLTGRTHQIRLHLSSIRHPVIGDRIYGRKATGVKTRMFLHAQSLELILPNGKPMKFTSPLPPELDPKLFLKGNR